MLHRSSETLYSLGLLVVRAGMGALLVYGHGWPKLAHFAERSASFSDPLGVGPAASLGLVVFAEVLCAALVAIGLLTRVFVLPLLIFFGVAVFIQHVDDPFQRKELALAFAVPYAAILIAGAGRFSVDGILFKGKR